MTTTFTYAPSYGATATRKPRIKSLKFGDGYEQRWQDGINAFAQVWDLQFQNRSTTEAAAIDEFLYALGGVSYFYWTPPASGAVEGKYICKEWTRTISLANAETITAQFIEVFDQA